MDSQLRVARYLFHFFSLKFSLLDGCSIVVQHFILRGIRDLVNSIQRSLEQ